MPVVEYPLDREFPDRHQSAESMLWAFGERGQGCRAAVIDTGVDSTSLDEWRALGARVHAVDLTRNREGALATSPESHGTGVVERLLQHSPLAEVFSLRVYGADGMAERTDFMRAIEWCSANRISLANISATFYSGCSGDCELCRAINTVALATGMLSVVASGDAYTLNENLEAGANVAMCPAVSGLAWGVASDAIVAARAPLASEEGGLSFTAARMSGGVALLRSAFPRMGLMLLRFLLQRTCLPHTSDTPLYLGLGRHSIVLAYFCGVHLMKVESGRLTKTSSLAEPSSRKRGQADENICQALEKVCSPLLQKDWAKALELAEMVEARIAPWAPTLERAIVGYIRAALLEGLGRTEDAAGAYSAHSALLKSYWAAVEAGVVGG